MAQRKQVDGLASLLMVGLCLIWGAQQVAIKAVAEDVSPAAQIVIRSGVAALLVWLVSRLWGREPWLRGVWTRAGVVVGVLFAAEFLFIAEGLRHTTAAHMAVFLYTAPLFAAMGLHFRLPEERLNTWQWLGMALAFAGVAAIFLAPRDTTAGLTGSGTSLLGDALALCAGAAWGFTTVAVRTSRLSEAPATQTLFYQLSGAFVLLLPLALATTGSALHFTPQAMTSLAFQALVVSFASYLIWFRMLRHYLAGRLGVMGLMTPIFGVLMGALWLGESLSLGFLGGAGLALGGMLLVNLSKGRSPAMPPSAAKP
ncbi:DMT family transporter [Pseudomonas sp. DTU_2021_1001937_2_SI_NGA_ILE_001]|uniref:DMT family transporter n=1 Tax=Pseudomonas sp. DTU_2021_1001937_2_SI_NGA_ILE_001 TaxID=3077589 RepID=UPI0028FC3086|nr:DMT family transporter [Pseudomonas sp. DTU_2021_1001937_2_SI_NGA_ILE_001]WNW10307.1 DMT family transporter [Pseudomonas sp. DTU_2021_1001937_2_SI_NGA_ILE_001]